MFSQHHFLVSLIDFYISSGSVVMGTLSGIHFTPHDGFTTSSSLRIPFASTSYAKLPLRVSFVTASGIIVCPSCVHRVSIGRLRTCFGSTLAFYQIRDENRAKLKISYSCGHRVSKSARYDATLWNAVDVSIIIIVHAHSHTRYVRTRIIVYTSFEPNTMLLSSTLRTL